MGRDVPVIGTAPDADGRELDTFSSTGMVLFGDEEEILFDGRVAVGVDTDGAEGGVSSQVLSAVR